MNKFVKAPAGLLTAPFYQRGLLLEGGVQVAESCTHFQESTGSMYLQSPLLLFVLAGTYTIRHGGQQHVVQAGKMVLLQRAIQLEYHKVGDPLAEFRFDCLMFFLRDDFVKEFAQQASPTLPRANQLVPVTVRPVGELLGSHNSRNGKQR